MASLPIIAALLTVVIVLLTCLSLGEHFGAPAPALLPKAMLTNMPAGLNQVHTNSCWTQATANAFKYMMMNKYKTPASVLEAMPSRPYIHYRMYGANNIDEGGLPYNALCKTNAFGWIREDHWGWSALSRMSYPNPKMYSEMKRTKLTVTITDNSLSSIKDAIDHGSIVVFNLAFHYPPSGYHGDLDFPAPSPQDRDGGGHAMIIYGYDDNTSSFNALNSWSMGYGTGINGYSRMHYDYYKKYRLDRGTIVLESIEDQPPFPPPTSPLSFSARVVPGTPSAVTGSGDIDPSKIIEHEAAQQTANACNDILIYAVNKSSVAKVEDNCGNNPIYFASVMLIFDKNSAAFSAYIRPYVTVTVSLDGHETAYRAAAGEKSLYVEKQLTFAKFDYITIVCAPLA